MYGVTVCDILVLLLDDFTTCSTPSMLTMIFVSLVWRSIAIGWTVGSIGVAIIVGALAHPDDAENQLSSALCRISTARR